MRVCWDKPEAELCEILIRRLGGVEMEQNEQKRPRIVVMGSYVTDLMGRAQRIPVAGETVKGDLFKTGPGGKGGNQAVAAARAGGSVAMITKLGADVFGDLALQNFDNEGIDRRFAIRTEAYPTGAALIMVSKETGQNSIVVIPGACENLTAEEVEAAMRALLPADILMLQLETNLEALEESLRMASESGLKVMLNPAPAQEIPQGFYKMIDYLTPNERSIDAFRNRGRFHRAREAGGKRASKQRCQKCCDHARRKGSACAG